MRHITQDRLDELEPMLVELRGVAGLAEKKRGVFYRRSRAFLHFHEDPQGLFADARLGGDDFRRFDVTRRKDQRSLVQKIRKELNAS